MTDLESSLVSLVGSFAKMAPPQTALEQAAFLTRRIDALGMDSLDQMELVMQIEERFDVALEEDAVLACVTVADLAALLGEAQAV